MDPSLFVLTTVDPRRRLPTIRSRAVPVRLQRLSDAEVRGFLQREIEPALAPQLLEVRVSAAAGSIGEAFAAGEESGKHW
jgi:DNA polymerase III gamma/tau subunit